MVKMRLFIGLYCALGIEFVYSSFEHEWKGDKYNKNSSFQENVATEVLNQYSLDPAHHVLDVGCGDGKITDKIAASLTSGSVLGVDIAPSMIEFAQQHYKRPNLSFQLCDVTQMNFFQEFDDVVSFLCLHGVPQVDLALINIAQSLKSGGRFVCCLGEGHSDQVLLGNVLLEVSQRPKWEPLFRYFDFVPLRALDMPWANRTSEELVESLKNLGFTIHCAERRLRSTIFNSFEEFKNFLDAAPWGYELPDDLRLEFIDEAARNYLKVTNQENMQAIEYKQNVFVIVGNRN